MPLWIYEFKFQMVSGYSILVQFQSVNEISCFKFTLLNITLPYIACGFAAVCGVYSQTFTSNGTLIIPPGVYSVRAFAVGGGGGGRGGHITGGGGGYVSCGTFNVTGGDNISIVVGAGGAGGFAYLWGSPVSTEGMSGGTSSFGSLLSASGGHTDTAGVAGSSGGTGAGSFCMWGYCSNGSYTGAGGSGGSNGETGNSTIPSGSGQGIANYTACLQVAVFHQL